MKTDISHWTDWTQVKEVTIFPAFPVMQLLHGPELRSFSGWLKQRAGMWEEESPSTHCAAIMFVWKWQMKRATRQAVKAETNTSNNMEEAAPDCSHPATAVPTVTTDMMLSRFWLSYRVSCFTLIASAFRCVFGHFPSAYFLPSYFPAFFFSSHEFHLCATVGPSLDRLTPTCVPLHSCINRPWLCPNSWCASFEARVLA